MIDETAGKGATEGTLSIYLGCIGAYLQAALSRLEYIR